MGSVNSAYRAEAAIDPDTRQFVSLAGLTGEVHLVECSGPGLDTWTTRIGVRAPDGRSAQDFLATSLVGQVISLLAQEDALPETWELLALGGGMSPLAGSIEYDDAWDQWRVWLPLGFARVIPRVLVLAAANSFDLKAAHRGECLDVDPDEFENWKAGNPPLGESPLRSEGE